MKHIPKGMTEEEVLKQIDVVINRIAPRYVFYGWTIDDVKQQSFLICAAALERYDNKRPLENFLSFNLANRLKNCIRDNHYLSGDDESKKKIRQPGQLVNEDTTQFYVMKDYDNIDTRELVDVINLNLPYNHRENYLKLLNNVQIPKKDRDEITEVIREIVQEHLKTNELSSDDIS